MSEETEIHNNKTEFNAGIATLYRLDEIKKQLHSVHLKPNFWTHYQLLKCFYQELRPIISIGSIDKLEDYDKKYEYINYVYDQIQKKQFQNKKVPQELINYFEQWEFHLRALEQELGLNMPKQKDSRFALSKRR